ncbi:MAG: nicotinate (nicotinamide) nucleotide adenylyltransferase [Helicobacteraceae bacterium]|nr:nicotinate (nicotinamide) nucleotide adenylyltransferase [Helicobacteraceae bacterium]
MNIAIYGGSFDPLHFGHKKVVETALDELEIDRLIIVPTFLNPFKKEFFLEPNRRLNSLKKEFFNLKKVEISSFEIDLKRSVSTIETVKHFKKGVGKIFLIIGADNLKNLHKWKNFEELNSLVTWVIASRDAIDIPSTFKTIKVDVDISSTKIRKKMQDIKFRVEKISRVLDDNKADAIEVFDLKDQDYIVDYVVLATSLGIRHTEALLNHLKNNLKPAEEFLHIDESGDWIAIDLGDIFIHIMTAETRVKYDMEGFLASLKKTEEK